MENRPNILFLFSDQHRGDWMPYDQEEKERQGVGTLDLDMPNLRGMMDRGTTFSSAITPAPICAPARACLAAGKRYRKCRVYTNNANYDPALPSFYKELSDSGYTVTGVGKFDLNKADLEWGDGCHKVLREMGFTGALDSEGKMDTVWAVMQGKPGPYGRMLQEHGELDAYVEDMSERGCSSRPCPISDECYADNWIGRNGCSMLSDLPSDRPWFMQVNFSGPHDPWDITEKMKKRVSGRAMPEAADCSFKDANIDVRRNYAAMIENIDRIIGDFLKVLSGRPDASRTMVVYASDHGEMMGDHGLYGKAKPGQGSVHVPLVIDSPFPGTAGGKLNRSPVELQDLAATFLDYAGIARKDSLDSVSLRPIVEGEKEKARDYAISELLHPNPKGLFKTFGTATDGRYKLILESSSKEPRLYDLEEDPFEMNDISAENPEKVQELKAAFLNRGKINPVAALYSASFNVG